MCGRRVDARSPSVGLTRPLGQPPAMPEPIEGAPRSGRPQATAPGTDESGSGSILAVAVLACVLGLAAVVVPTNEALVVKQRVVAAADAAALAAADTAAGVVAGIPCEAGNRTAERNGATLTACRVDGITATVTASASWLGMPISVTARAGPPAAEPG